MIKLEVLQERTENMPETVKNIINQLTRNSDKFNISQVKHCIRADGGAIHYVYKIVCTDNSSYYLKIREDHLSGLPQYQQNPQDIINEKNSLLYLAKLFPNLFPKIIYWDEQNHFIVIEDLFSEGGMRVDELLYLGLSENLAIKLAEKVGLSVGKIHKKLSTKKSLRFINREQSKDKFILKLKQKLRHSDNPLFTRTIEQHSKSRLQPILGDLAPKNIAFTNKNEVRFFDTEDFCFGTIEYEIAYFIGQVILHFLARNENPLTFITKFLDIYSKNAPQFNTMLVKATSIAIILHRINSPAPYRIQLTNEKKQQLLKKLSLLIETFQKNELSWEELIKFLL